MPSQMLFQACNSPRHAFAMIELRNDMQMIRHQHTDHGFHQSPGFIECQRSTINRGCHRTGQLISSPRLTANRDEPLIFLINPGRNGVIKTIPGWQRHRHKMLLPGSLPKQESHQEWPRFKTLTANQGWLALPNHLHIASQHASVPADPPTRHSRACFAAVHHASRSPTKAYAFVA